MNGQRSDGRLQPTSFLSFRSESLASVLSRCVSRALICFCLVSLSSNSLAQQENANPDAKQEVIDTLKQIRDELKQNQPVMPNQDVKLPEQPTELTDLNGIGRDAIDEHLPIDREQLNLFRLALRKHSEKQYPEVLTLIQRLLSEPEDSVYLDQNFEVHSLKQSAKQLLFSVPQAERNEFSRQRNQELQRLYQQAIDQKELSLLAELAEQWPMTIAGHLAANDLASHALDQGDLNSALYWLNTLWDSGSSLKNDPLWLIKYATANAYSPAPQGRLREVIGQLLSVPAERLPTEFQRYRTTEQWLKQFEVFRSSLSPSLPEPVDYLDLYANPNRQLGATLPQIVLQPAWSKQLSQLNSVASQLTEISSDLSAHGIPAFPMSSPIVTDQTVVLRSMVGVEAYQLDTGTLLWQRPDYISAERLLIGPQATRFADQQLGELSNNPGVIKPYDGDDLQRHPLTSLMYRNGLHHSLSSDGKRVFAIVDHAILSERPPGMIWNFNHSQRDSFRRSWNTNRLIALNLQTGQTEWSVGGPDREEQFSDETTGTLFLGPPTCVDGIAYCIGEQDQLLRLYALSCETGSVLWQQSIGMVDVAIDRDLGRRWWLMQPTYHDGLLICPTGLGYLTAVDQTTHEIRWMTRYAPVEQRRSGRLNMEGRFAMTEAGDLLERWPMMPPIVSNGVVCLAPSDVPALFLFDLKTGELTESLEKEDGLFVAGTWQSQLVVVMPDHVQLLRLPDFRELNRIPFELESIALDLPNGRPVLSGSSLWQSFHNGTLLEIDLNTKTLKSLGQLSQSDMKFGNLFPARKGLVSVSASSILFLPSQSQQQIAPPPQQSEFHYATQYRTLQQLISAQQFSQARQLIVSVPWESISRQQQDELIDLLIDVVSHHQEQDHEVQLKTLNVLIDKAVNVSQLQHGLRMKADLLIDQRNPIAAFWTILELINKSSDQLQQSVEDPNWVVSDHVWAEEKLEQIWNAASGPTYSQLQLQLAEFQERLLKDETRKTSRAWSTLLTFRIAAGAISPEEIPLIAESFSVTQSESYLLRLLQSPDEMVRATACLSLASVMRNAGLEESANRYYRQAQSDYWEVTLTNGQTVREFFESQPNLETISKFPSRPGWSDQKFELIAGHEVTAESNLIPVDIEGKFSPFMLTHRVEYDPEYERLLIRRLNDGSVYWSISLPSVDRRGRLRSLEAVLCGHQLTLVHRGVACSLSLIERRMIWSERIDNFIETRTTRSRNSRRHLKPLHLARTLRTRYRIGLMERSASPIVLATPQFIVLQGRTELEVRSASEGRILWRRRGIPSGCLIAGDEKALLVINQGNAPQLQLLRTSDGKLLFQEMESDWIEQCVALVGHDLIIADAPSVRPGIGVIQDPVTMSRYSLLNQETVWTMTIDSESFLSLVDDEIAIELTPDATLECISLQDGKREHIADIPQKTLQESSERACVRSGDELYVQFNGQRNQYFQANMETLHVKGELYGFRISTLEPMWEKPLVLPECHWVMEDFNSLPVLVFLNRDVVSEHGLKFVELSFQLIDRQTGTLLFSHQQIGQSTLHSFQSNLATRELYFSAHNSHYCIRPKQSVP